MCPIRDLAGGLAGRPSCMESDPVRRRIRGEDAFAEGGEDTVRRIGDPDGQTGRIALAYHSVKALDQVAGRSLVLVRLSRCARPVIASPLVRYARAQPPTNASASSLAALAQPLTSRLFGSATTRRLPRKPLVVCSRPTAQRNCGSRPTIRYQAKRDAARDRSTGSGIRYGRHRASVCGYAPSGARRDDRHHDEDRRCCMAVCATDRAVVIFRLNRDLPADLDDRVRRQPEIVGQVRGVALHRGEHGLYPLR